ncbi:hypothetical protein WSK_1027 [Novosphingobium sp. Rr 2-17]|uniref:hypothetical protein n=1 Tax=Novosphingobium sp. Rr 2-17 TaxID=555793 RepID=UPI0002699B64|nr:hypothetical protein [Novosphingobium sp. Rr 2-17]EIZ80467.1 hypothetical protein WSK_1027 [Novosphingobium sp. Rr 2-17]
MAHRLLLTLLALLTGLAAQIGPAQACASRVASVQVAVAGESPAVKPARAPAALARLPEPGLLNARRYAPQAAPAPQARIVPTVLIGIDRARD